MYSTFFFQTNYSKHIYFFIWPYLEPCYHLNTIPGEALGAIGDQEALPVLEQYSKDSIVEVHVLYKHDHLN